MVGSSDLLIISRYHVLLLWRTCATLMQMESAIIHLGEVQVLRHAADLETIDFLHQWLIIELLLALSGASDS